MPDQPEILAVEEIIPLLGLSAQDPKIKDLLSSLGVSKPVPRPRRGDDSSDVVIQSYGAEFLFGYSEDLPREYALRLPEGDVALFDVQIRGRDPRKAAHWRLPNGIQFSDSLGLVISKLGEPTNRGDELPVARWDRGKIYYHVYCAEDWSSIWVFRLGLDFP